MNTICKKICSNVSNSCQAIDCTIATKEGHIKDVSKRLNALKKSFDKELVKEKRDSDYLEMLNSSMIKMNEILKFVKSL